MDRRATDGSSGLRCRFDLAAPADGATTGGLYARPLDCDSGGSSDTALRRRESGLADLADLCWRSRLNLNVICEGSQ